jgi:hypothetical protein
MNHLHPADHALVRPDDAFALATSMSLNRDGSVMADYVCPRTGACMKVRMPEGYTAWRIIEEPSYGVWVVLPVGCPLTRTSTLPA